MYQKPHTEVNSMWGIIYLGEREQNYILFITALCVRNFQFNLCVATHTEVLFSVQIDSL
jgi:hypothetical protein